MTRFAKVVLVAAAIALVYGLYAAGTRAYSWMKGPEPGSRPWQIQQFRKDWRACSQFAHKREEARKLLAWKPSFRTVGRGTLGPSPVAEVQRGAVIWEVTGGEGRLAGAQGLITSNFTVGAQGEVVDDQFARLFVP